MKTNTNIQDKIDQTINAAQSIDAVTVSPFFKDKTMQRLFTEKEVASKSWHWFTPQLQLATLVCVVVLNVYAIQQIKSTKYNEASSSFASDYGLKSNTDGTLINL